MICTFYSYKGGVGRSMALANVADSLVRSGLKVLMIDFDLEAPGLEQFFQINRSQVRRNLGLLDLLLSYKQAMSGRAVEQDDEPPFMRLTENFIQPVYPELPLGGRLDLLAAGQREDEEQLARYALNLRTFDWQDFYFNWAGETFFEWLRRSLLELYDVVLVDSRTGLTEMGGICAYQLADLIVMLCASNHQNVEGTRNLVKNFFSPRVQARRRHRPLQVVVVAARVEQLEGELLESFRQRFEKAFGEYTPEPLRRVGLTFWDLLIPYEPRYAFEEQVVTEPVRAEERREMAEAFQELVRAIVLLAEPGTTLAELKSARETMESRQVPLVEPQYDITRRSAGYDVFLAHNSTDTEAVEIIARRLREEAHLEPFLDQWRLVPGAPWQEAIEEALFQSRSCAVFIGPSGLGPWQSEEFRAALEMYSGDRHLRVFPVLLPNARPDQLPPFLAMRVGVDFRAGLDDAEAFERLVSGIRELPPEQPKTTVEYGNPYRGLVAFGEGDALFFFGRETLTQYLVNRLRRNRFLAVIGPSGSGKSSLVRAGLIPQLRQGALPTSDHWPIVQLRPGPHPLEALAAALLSLYADLSARQPLLETLRQDERGLYSTVQAMLAAAPDDRRFLVIVDQFEELFTLCYDESERRHFIDNLLYASTMARGRAVVVIVLRADFYGQCAAYPGLAAMLSDHQVLVGPMSEEELRRAIEKPAQVVGLNFEQGLVEAILAEVENAPGALPLLQFALYELWDRRRGGWLTHTAYREIGGIAGALAHRADGVMQQFTPEQQAIARRIFLRLTELGEGVQDTRRRATLTELSPRAEEQASIEPALQTLVEARLVTTDQGTAEVAHEALIREWPTLRQWLNDNREGLRLHRQLSEAMEEWQRLNRDPGVLYRGAKLAQAGEWAEQYPAELNASEWEFLTASKQAEENERLRELEQARALAEEQQRRAETERQRAEEQSRAAAQLRRRAFWLGGAFVLAIIAVYVAIWFGQQAISNAALAQAEATRAINAEVAARAERDRALTALEEVSLSNQAAATSYSPDGKRLITIATDRSVKLWNVTGKTLATLGEAGSAVTSASFSPDGKFIVTAAEDGQVRLWEAATGELLAVFVGHTARVRKATFSPTGRLLATASDDGTGLIWEIATGNSLFVLKGHTGPVIDIGFSPDGNSIFTSSTDGTTRVWDAASGQLITVLIGQQ